MLTAKPFYLIRHGQCLANEFNRLAGGGNDSPLTTKGELQAKQLAPYLTQLKQKPGNIFHSPMIRAQKTAQILNADIKLGMSCVERLREQKFGQWENQPWDKIKDEFFKRPRPPGGESSKAFMIRIISAINDIHYQNISGTGIPMLVAHGGLFYALADHLDVMDGMQQIANCQLHLFEPKSSNIRNPWEISAFEINKGKLKKVTAQFCPTTKLKP